jgi:branched-chain amino acid transport system ATP-binding protein
MFTAFENIQSAILMYHRKQMDLFSRSSRLFREETLEVLSAIELTQVAEKIASTLPYGDQRKLEIGIALSFSPELLLLDEPTAGMSRHERFAMAELIQRLAHDRGLTVVFIEHDMDVVLSISEKVRVMHQGRIITQGKPEEIKKNDEVKRVYLGGEKK